MYDRTLRNPNPIPRPESHLRYRIETVIGVTGAKMAEYRASWRESILACVDLIWRPHLFGILLLEVCLSNLHPTAATEFDANNGIQGLVFGFASPGLNVSGGF